MASHEIDLDGMRIAYEEHGKGFPLLALHGFYPDRRLMTGALEPFFADSSQVRIPPSASRTATPAPPVPCSTGPGTTSRSSRPGSSVRWWGSGWSGARIATRADTDSQLER